MNNQTASTPETRQLVLGAVAHILRPLIRLLLSQGITYTVFSDAVRTIYVKVADEEFKLPDKPQTDSRVSLLTGIHRREVNRLRNEPVQEITLSESASMSALLLATWNGDPEYVDSDGMAAALPRLASKGGERSFESMVQSISKDFRPRVVLDEWLRQGIVRLDDDDNVHLLPEAFAQPQEMDEKAFYFGQNIHDHLAATGHNLSGAQPPFLERCVFYDKLSAESVNDLAAYSRTVGMRALQAVNKRAAELQKRDRHQAAAVYRTNFGVYQYSAPEAAHEDSGK